MAQDKEEQKKLLVEIMETDAKDGLYKQQTAIEYLLSNLPNRFRNAILNECSEEIEKAKQMEMEKTIMDYNAGYDDAQCNHINDAKNYANERKYINEK
jgi:hypothetical protein